MSTAAGSAVLDVKNVTAGYGGMVALRDISFTLSSGDCMAVLGSNGAGKSTLAKVLGAQLAAMKGSVTFEGVDVTEQSTDARARDGLVCIPEGRAIFPGLTVSDNVTMCARRAGGRKERQAAAAAVYERFPLLYERRNQIAGTLSGGESRLLALSHIFGAPPRVLIVDELSIGLSPLAVAAVYEHLAAANAAGVAVIVIEQFVENALRLAKQAMILARGTMIFQGDKDLLLSSPEYLDYLGSEREA